MSNFNRLAVIGAALTAPTLAVNCTAASTCGDCVQHVGCYWCSTSSTCEVTFSGGCSLMSSYWESCQLSTFWVLFVFTIVTVFLCSLCCCICYQINDFLRRRRIAAIHLDEEQSSADREARAVGNNQRRTERRSMANSIRARYGLPTTDNTYTRVEDDDDDDE